MTEIKRQPYRLSVVIPLYSEGSHLDTTLNEIILVLDALGTAYELILVDDGSPDNTWKAIMGQCKLRPNVKGLRLSRNFGKEAALAAGLEHTSGDAIVVMDGDLQHPPSLIPVMVNAWQEGADVVEAVKQFRGHESVYSKVRSKVFYSLFSRLTGHDLRGASDFKLLDRRVLEAWRKMGERNLFFRGMTSWLGFKSTKISFDVPDRVDGESGWSILQLVRLAMTAVTAFSSAPLHLITLSGIGFAIFAIILGAQTLYHKLIGHAVDGFTTVILLLLIIGGVTMLGLGITGTYIARIYEEVKGRPRYIIAEQAGK
jgi:glycosyltransferase involved in cell wall biosynthesis